MCVCACVRACVCVCVRARARACARVCGVGGGGRRNLVGDRKKIHTHVDIFVPQLVKSFFYNGVSGGFDDVLVHVITAAKVVPRVVAHGRCSAQSVIQAVGHACQA